MGTNGAGQTNASSAQNLAIGVIECPLCHGAGALSRTEILDRLGVKDVARIAHLSAEEAFRLLKDEYRQDTDALWSRYQSELTRRLAESAQTHNGRVQELEAQLKLVRERSGVEVQSIRGELEGRIRTEQSSKEDFRRKVEEYSADVSRLRMRNAELEAEVAKAAKRGRLEEVSFEEEVRSWSGICIGEKLAKNGDYVLSFRDSSGCPA